MAWWSSTSSTPGYWYVSSELARKVQVGLEELAIVRRQFDGLMSIEPDADPGVIETSAACAMLHSFYTGRDFQNGHLCEAGVDSKSILLRSDRF